MHDGVGAAAAGKMHQAVPRADLIGRAILPAETGAAENEEDLLLGAVDVRGGGLGARLDGDASQTGRNAARGGPEIGEAGAQMAL